MSNQSFSYTDNLACPRAVDNSFGPVVSGCRNNFDFTLLFEQSVLTFIPAALLLLVAPLRLLQLHKSDVKTRPASISQLKLVSSCV